RHRGRVPDGRAHRHRDRVQYSGRRALSRDRAHPARLSDRAESGDVRCGHRGSDQLPGRHALRRARPAHQIFRGVTMATLDFDAELTRAGAHARGRLGRLRHMARRYPLGAAGAAIMALFVFAAVFANLLTAYDPLSTNAAESLCAPGRAHWLGCDNFGRDMLARIIFGARISLAVGIGSTVIGSGLGIMIGLASGYLGGWIDL